LVWMTDYGATLIWELIYFTQPTREGTEVHFWAFGRPREFHTFRLHLETFRREEIDLDILRDVEIEDLQYLGLGDDECRRFVAARDANF